MKSGDEDKLGKERGVGGEHRSVRWYVSSRDEHSDDANFSSLTSIPQNIQYI